MPSEPLLEVRNLRKSYGKAPLADGRGSERGGKHVFRFLSRARQQAVSGVVALQGVSLRVEKGSTLAIVGLSGSGKSTLARAIALFDPPDSGEILLHGRNIWRAGTSERRALHSRIQLIFQQSAASLNPRFTAEEILCEPLIIQKQGDARSRRERAIELMRLVNLPPEALPKTAMAFSGGERQRLAIARAMAVEPELLILDESLSGVDLPVQRQIVSLLQRLQEKLGLTYILISHDLDVVARLAGTIAVMDAGTIVESGPADALMAAPSHPCTQQLVEAGQTLGWEGAPL